MSAIIIGAPFAGYAFALSHVCDPVFAEGMMGGGLAIEPLDDTVRAPAAATVEAVAPTGHSVTLVLANGASLLIHVGINTVALGGAGFRPLVTAGDAVEVGAPLIALDLDMIARGARSLATPIVVASEGYAVEPLVGEARIAAGAPIMRIVPLAGEARSTSTGGDRRELEVPLAHGLHARPAARIAALVRERGADVRIEAHGSSADARSPIGIMKLSIRRGDRIALVGDAAATAAIAELIAGGMGETDVSTAPVAVPAATSIGSIIAGIPAAPGLAIGPAFRMKTVALDPPERGEGIALERARLDAALAAVAERSHDGDPIGFAHRMLLADPALIDAAVARIAAGEGAAFAWASTARAEAASLAALDDPRMAERAADLDDVGQQVAAEIMGVEPEVPRLPASAILLADDLLPSQFQALDAGAIAGIATAKGGPTSHVAILAAAAGVPMIVGCGAALDAVEHGARVAIDGGAGTLDRAPTERHEAALAAAHAQRSDQAALAHDAAFTRDGTPIEVFANLGSLADARAAVRHGAEGCGLLRTEFLFLDRRTAPDEDEQARVYADIAAALEGRPLIVRTLDIGGDKPVPYLPFAREDNPALGLRGMRLGLTQPELMRVQLRAILRGVPAGQCRIMLPMVIDRSDFTAIAALLAEAAAETGVPVPPLGVMIETPAAALVAGDLARDAAFLSIGSNDLTQYTLAADRGNPAVAARIDALHPAVLRLIAHAAQGAAAHGRWLGVCGGLASDPLAVPLLLGLGVTELSASPGAVPAIKAAVRAADMTCCRALAARALTLGTAREVREACA